MAKIPEKVLRQMSFLEGLRLLSQGKVRDTYELPDHPGKLLVVASDRISIFDFVLPYVVALKGEILNALNIYWRQYLGQVFPHDLVAIGAGIDYFLPPALRNKPQLQRRAVVVNKLVMGEFEAIVRGYLTGSGWEAYQATNPHQVCGHVLPDGLNDGSELPFKIFTPSTKATVGHDEHVDANFVSRKYGAGPERMALAIFEMASRHAQGRGVIIADSKFEFGQRPDGRWVIGDEVLTPDSSRYWDALAWQLAQNKGKVPPAFDKQFVRETGKALGIHKCDPGKPEDVEHVHTLGIDAAVFKHTTRLYRYIFWRLTGMLLEEFQTEMMGVRTQRPERVVHVVLGSKSDLPQAQRALIFLRNRASELHVNVISCHRNTEALRAYAIGLCDGHRGGERQSVVIAGAGMAAALPGMLTSILDAHLGNDIPVLGVAVTGQGEINDTAARLSISQLPGSPVIIGDHGYEGEAGFTLAAQDAVGAEFLPRQPVDKPALIDMDWQALLAEFRV